MGDVGRVQRLPPAEGGGLPPRGRRPLATSAVGDGAGKKKRRLWRQDDDTIEKTVWIQLVEKKRQAIVEKHFDVSWLELDDVARASLFYYLVDHGKVDGGTAAPETTEEGCMPPPSPADSEATLHLPTHDELEAQRDPA